MKFDGMTVDVPIGEILPNRYSPRLEYTESHIDELTESIRKWGIIQPLLVRRLGDRYEIIDGEYRCRAAKKAALNSVPVVVVDQDYVSEKDIASLTCAIFYHHERHSVVEESIMYQTTSKVNSVPFENLGEITGIPQGRINSCRPLLEHVRADSSKSCEVIETLKKHLNEMGLDDYTTGADLNYNYYINVDNDGFIVIRDGHPGYDLTLRRVRTTVNVNDITEFRKDDVWDNTFYMLDRDCCGLWFSEDGVYYIYRGEASGWGTAYEHFTKFPNNEGFEK